MGYRAIFLLFLLATSLHASEPMDLNQALYMAVIDPTRSASEVHTLLTQGADANHRVRNRPLLHHALAQKSFLKALLLLKHGADPKSVDNALYTPLHLAAATNSLEVVKALTHQNVDLNALDKNGRSPLWFAVAFDYVDIVKWLLISGLKADRSAFSSFVPQGKIALWLQKQNQNSCIFSKPAEPLNTFGDAFHYQTISPADCQKMQNRAFWDECITLQEFQELKKISGAPFCSSEHDFVAWVSCGPL